MKELTIGQQLEEICVKNNLRIGQLISITFGSEDLFYISNLDLINRIKNKLEELEDERLARQSKWDREMEEADNAWSER